MFADLGHFNKKSIQVISMVIFLLNKKPLVTFLSFPLADGIFMPSLSIVDPCIRWSGSIFDQEPI